MKTRTSSGEATRDRCNRALPFRRKVLLNIHCRVLSSSKWLKTNEKEDGLRFIFVLYPMKEDWDMEMPR